MSGMNFSIEIASVPDREELVAELWYGNEQVAELSQEGGELTLHLYPPRYRDRWEFGHAAFLNQLQQLGRRLRGTE